MANLIIKPSVRFILVSFSFFLFLFHLFQLICLIHWIFHTHSSLNSNCINWLIIFDDYYCVFAVWTKKISFDSSKTGLTMSAHVKNIHIYWTLLRDYSHSCCCCHRFILCLYILGECIFVFFFFLPKCLWYTLWESAWKCDTLLKKENNSTEWAKKEDKTGKQQAVIVKWWRWKRVQWAIIKSTANKLQK